MAESSVLRYKIDALAGAENWQTWKVRLSDILIDADLWDYVSGDLTCTSPLAANAKAEEKAAKEKEISGWKAKDRKALTAIRLRVADKVLIYVKAALTSHDAWKKLETMYEAQGILAIVQARRKMFRAACTEDQDVEEFIRQMTGYRDDLLTLQQTVSEEELSISLLTALPESWNTFTAALDYRTGLKDSAELIARILDEDRRVKSRAEETALHGKFQKAKGKGKRPLPNCWKHNKPGYQADCPDHEGARKHKEEKRRTEHTKSKPKDKGSEDKAMVADTSDADTEDYAFSVTDIASHMDDD
ncbi:hypothetical protein EVJ58_g9698 [Rhodofomes roseus]|uniref:DUF4219 domain-containing protein n=1 Tax=Rhodofomes roseus TaxID=34475 RepID=A0A4Y9XSA5_9APHY|nr:hypothetical protein EVJ58_g9698 [Rhodofomes roseus]